MTERQSKFNEILSNNPLLKEWCKKMGVDTDHKLVTLFINFPKSTALALDQDAQQFVVYSRKVMAELQDAWRESTGQAVRRTFEYVTTRPSRA